MEPTISAGEWWIADQLADPKINDIVLVKFNNDEPDSVKRIYADHSSDLYYYYSEYISPETISIFNHYEIRYNYATKEDLGDLDIWTDYIKISLEEDEYVVYGDNIDLSYDSREAGPVDRSQIKGVLITKISYE